MCLTTCGWFEIRYQDHPAFVSNDYIDLLEHAPRLSGIVSADMLHVRDRPSMNGAVLGTLSEGARVDILTQLDKWLEIKFQHGSA